MDVNVIKFEYLHTARYWLSVVKGSFKMYDPGSGL